MRRSYNALAASALTLVIGGFSAGQLLIASDLAAQSRTVIEKKDDLPRHRYRLPVAATKLYAPENRGALRALGAEIRRDLEADLAAYEIRDDNTIQEFYGVLGSIALLEEDWQGYLDYLEKRRALESKEANRLTMGLVGEALAESRLAGRETAESVAQKLQEKLRALPFATVEANLKGLKGSTETLSRALVLGSIESNYQPIIDRNEGEASYDIAATLVNASFSLDYFLPLAADVRAVLVDAIAANHVDKEDIWAQRQVVLADFAEAGPVTLAVWDSGVDTAIFGATGQLWSNTEEIAGNGVDDDDNGFVDDVHGIGYDLRSNYVSQSLYPIGEVTEDRAVLEQRIKGLGDIQYNVDSPEAGAVRQELASLAQEDVQEFLESISIYANYSHGTHVAGIATQGNPFARVLVTRMTYGHKLLPEKPTLANAHREAAMFLEVGEYFRSNGVRVVNMSWGGSVRGIEEALEAHAAGESAAERKALAREIFAIGDEALRRVIAESPEILFVTSSGNSDNDVRFDEFYPSSYEYPNLLSVGAVDSAGDETSFTSLGKVDLYSNGFEVESYVPGGNRIAFNGTSMASPQVMNLAGKLLALYPGLSTTELRDLLLDGGELRELETRSIRLINPKATVELAAERYASKAYAES